MNRLHTSAALCGLLILLCLLPLTASARGLSLSVGRAAAGQPFEVTYTVSGQDGERIQLQGAWGHGLQLLSGPNISRQSSYSIGTGGTTSSSTTAYTYVLVAQKPGRYAIPGAKVGAHTCGGTTVSVQKGSSQRAPSADPFDQMDQMQRQMQQRMQQYLDAIDQMPAHPAQQPTAKIPAGRRTYLAATANKRSAYEQEAIYLTYKLYSVDEPTDLLRNLDPKFDDFQYKEIPPKGKRAIHIERVGGVDYFAVTMYEYVLFPQRAGRLVIPPLNIDVQTNRGLDDGRVTAKADSVVFSIKPLPTRPEGFCGAVGHDFTVEAAVSTGAVATGDAFSYRLTVKGTGNLQLMTAPALTWPDRIESYDAKKTENTEITTEGCRGSVVFDYALVPHAVGTTSLKPAALVYFDTMEGRYKTLRTRAFSIKVKKGKGRAHADDDSDDSDIAPILTGPLSYTQPSAHNALWYVIPLILFVVAYGLLRYMLVGRKGRQPAAARVATRRLRRAKTLREEGRRDEFYDEVMHALIGYVSDTLHIPNTDLNKDNVQGEMRSRGVDESLVATFIDVLEECERARFAPGDPKQTLRRIYDDAFRTITQLDTLL